LPGSRKGGFQGGGDRRTGGINIPIRIPNEGGTIVKYSEGSAPSASHSSAGAELRDPREVFPAESGLESSIIREELAIPEGVASRITTTAPKSMCARRGEKHHGHEHDRN